jgi:LysM repeat protein
MRRRLILLGSVGLNVAFAAVLLYAWERHSHPQSQTPVTENAGSNVVHTHVVVRKQFFSWEELESADYPTYIANLRAIGCPEQTIRDIIVADVDQLYARKRADVPTPAQQWWRYDPDPELAEQANTKLGELDQERRELLTTLLGPAWAVGEAADAAGISLAGPVLGELPPETKRAVLEAVVHSQQRTQAYLDAQKIAEKSPDPATLAKMGQQMRTDLAQILNPAQLEEFLLRYSQSAASLRLKLRGIQVTPDEFRSLFRTADPLEQSSQLAEGDVLARTNQQVAATRQIEDALKNVLGATRYQAYQISQEPAYQQALATAEEYGDLTSKDIIALYQLNKAALQEQQRINNNVMLTPEQRDAQLAIIERQQQNASDQILGLTPEPPLPPIPATAPAQIHPYRAAETVDMIAAQYGVSSSAILSANPTLNFHLLSPGTPIRIPLPPTQ